MNPKVFGRTLKGDKTHGKAFDTVRSLMGELGIRFEKSCGIFRVYGVETAVNFPCEDLGFLSFHFSASKVSTLGADPKLVISSLLVPSEIDSKKGDIIEDIRRESSKYHSDVVIRVNEVEHLKNPMVSTVVVGEARELLLPLEARVGDPLALIGVPGAEFLYSFATMRPHILERLDFREKISKWRDYKWMLSCLDAIRTIPSVAKVKGMLWVGENGILGSLDVLSRLTGMGFAIRRDYLELPPELVELTHHLGLDPLSVPSRGSVIVILSKDSPISQLKDVLDAHGYKVSFIGSLSSGDRGRR
ncbi:MAG: hypothetical protein QW418_04660 [Candidatus Korarchaeum sp.]